MLETLLHRGQADGDVKTNISLPAKEQRLFGAWKKDFNASKRSLAAAENHIDSRSAIAPPPKPGQSAPKLAKVGASLELQLLRR